MFGWTWRCVWLDDLNHINRHQMDDMWMCQESLPMLTASCSSAAGGIT